MKHLKKFNENVDNDWMDWMLKVIWSGDSAETCGNIYDLMLEGSYSTNMVDVGDGTYMIVGDEEAKDYWNSHIKYDIQN